MHSQELYNLDTTEWDARFVFSHLRDLEQHYTLITSLFMPEKTVDSPQKELPGDHHYSP